MNEIYENTLELAGYNIKLESKNTPLLPRWQFIWHPLITITMKTFLFDIFKVTICFNYTPCPS